MVNALAQMVVAPQVMLSPSLPDSRAGRFTRRHCLRGWLIAVAVVTASAAAVAAEQSQADSESVVRWVAEPGKGATVENGALQVTPAAGWLRTQRLYSDFVLQFEFRLSTPEAEACVGVRSWLGFGMPHSGYCVWLADTAAGRRTLGHVSASGARMGDVTRSPTAMAAARNDTGTWQPVQIRVERDAMTVTVNGIVVNTVKDLGEFSGYLVVNARRGIVEMRGIQLDRIPTAHTPFGLNAYRATDPDGQPVPGLRSPQPTRTAKPRYPVEPYDNWIQGTVGVEVVVLADGAIGDLRVARPLHPDLDEAAIGSARQWRFRPGTKDGDAAPIIVTIDVSFTRTR
jgi:TonB family protein